MKSSDAAKVFQYTHEINRQTIHKKTKLLLKLWIPFVLFFKHFFLLEISNISSFISFIHLILFNTSEPIYFVLVENSETLQDWYGLVVFLRQVYFFQNFSLLFYSNHEATVTAYIFEKGIYVALKSFVFFYQSWLFIFVLFSALNSSINPLWPVSFTMIR